MNKITYLNELETALDALPRHLRDRKCMNMNVIFMSKNLMALMKGNFKEVKRPTRCCS